MPTQIAGASRRLRVQITFRLLLNLLGMGTGLGENAPGSPLGRLEVAQHRGNFKLHKGRLSKASQTLSVEYHVDHTISVWGLASDLDAYKAPQLPSLLEL